jgi:hypothetical protein
MHQCVRLRHVVDAGRCPHPCVPEARIGIDSNVRLHPEVRPVALLGLVRLGIALATAALGRARRGDQRGINHRGALQKEPVGAGVELRVART